MRPCLLPIASCLLPPEIPAGEPRATRYHCSVPATSLGSFHRVKQQKTYTPRPADIERAWWTVDATDMPLGRISSEIARILRGKHKPIYTPHLDVGDHVIVINAEKVAVTSRKSEQKIYYRHSGFPGGIKAESFERLVARRPEAIIERAVRGMLPKNRLGRAMFRKLKVYAGPEHGHSSQKPQPLEFKIAKVETK